MTPAMVPEIVSGPYVAYTSPPTKWPNGAASGIRYAVVPGTPVSPGNESGTSCVSEDGGATQKLLKAQVTAPGATVSANSGNPLIRMPTGSISSDTCSLRDGEAEIALTVHVTGGSLPWCSTTVST